MRRSHRGVSPDLAPVSAQLAGTVNAGTTGSRRSRHPWLCRLTGGEVHQRGGRLAADVVRGRSCRTIGEQLPRRSSCPSHRSSRISPHADRSILVDVLWPGGRGPGRVSAAVPAAGRGTAALAAAGRGGPQRPAGPRADRPVRPAAEPGLLPPGPAAHRRAGENAAQLGGRPGRVLQPRHGALRGNRRAQSFLDGAGPAAIGAIGGSAILLARALSQPWQYAVLAAAAVLLLGLRRSGRQGAAQRCIAGSRPAEPGPGARDQPAT